MSISVQERLTNVNLDQCPLCLEDFDMDTHQPHFICLKNHNICCQCAEKQKAKKDIRCPICRRNINLQDLNNPNKYYKQFRQYEKEIADQNMLRVQETLEIKRKHCQQKAIILNQSKSARDMFENEKRERQKSLQVIKQIQEQRVKLREQRVKQQKKLRQLQIVIQKNLSRMNIYRHRDQRKRSPLRCNCGAKIKMKYAFCNFCKSRNY